MRLKESPSQTAGPYVHIGCAPQTAGLERRGMGPQLGRDMVRSDTAEKIDLMLTVRDGADDLVKDALIEIWQANADGGYAADERFSNWGRQATDLSTGLARFETIKPPASANQAPHILVWIVARGINLGLTTRIYFPDENNGSDPVLALAGTRAGTLIAEKAPSGYAHTIHLQGPQETVFFDV
ncbi:protocatechuate 3,4-dioxygenase subunit alpha [Yoonia sp. BS5-3]|uniref:Protocatechuate 3,4-dioxygenase subunit alpha n=1 Tax=Yoonia phaeophyticola TaxID=3137369 RepID=A0ABZ2V815_9RHOB